MHSASKRVTVGVTQIILPCFNRTLKKITLRLSGRALDSNPSAGAGVLLYLQRAL